MKKVKFVIFQLCARLHIDTGNLLKKEIINIW